MKPLLLSEKNYLLAREVCDQDPAGAAGAQERSRAGEDLWFYTVEVDPVAIFGNNVKCWEWDT